MAALFTFFLYEVLFDVTGGFPPTDMLPLWAVGVLASSMLLGILQARKHFVPGRVPVILLSAFVVDCGVDSSRVPVQSAVDATAQPGR